MKFVHKEKHAKKFVYHKFILEIPELAKLFEKEGHEWVKRKNERIDEEIKDLQSLTVPWDVATKKTKKQIKEDLKQLAEGLKSGLFKHKTLEDWKDTTACTYYDRIDVNKATGTFEFKVCREMSNFDILKGYNGRAKSGVTRWEDVIVAEKTIPPVLPAEPLTKQDQEEIKNDTWRYE